ncbi:MAG: hypothetical protein FWD44_01370 [Oscillospiraceae bacterium]|nr:hypothetical protein [Oscillospiraceae bacterium]
MKKLLTVTLCAILALSLFGITALASGLYMLDPNTPDSFAAEEDEGHIGYNFKGDGGAWVNINNPWGKSAYLITQPAEGTQTIIVTFKVEGYDGGAEGYRVMGGFIANEAWQPQVWALSGEREDTTSWLEIFGEEYYFFIDGDGIYELPISFRHAMDWFENNDPDGWEMEYLDYIQVIELGIFDPPSDTTMVVTLLDLTDTPDVFTFDELSRPLGSDKFFHPLPEGGVEPPIATLPGPVETDPDDTDTPEPPAETASPPPTQSPPSDDGGDGMPWWIWLCIGGGALVVVVIVVIIISKKK